MSQIDPFPKFADSCDETEAEKVPNGESNYITGKQIQITIKIQIQIQMAHR